MHKQQLYAQNYCMDQPLRGKDGCLSLLGIGQLSILVPYIPTNNPQLRDTAYEMALLALVTISAFHKQLLSTIHSWPSSIYSASAVISAIEQHLNMSFVTPTLKEALADFYVIDKQYEKAFAIYADLRKTANPSYKCTITAPNPSKWQRMVETLVWNANSSYSLSTCQI
jgi:hypothetical protein